MKKISLLSAALLSAGLVACGGGDPKSASDKPDTLFPEGYVPPVITSSSSSAPSNGPKQAIPFHENFDNANNTRAFFAATYKPLNSDAAKPFYYPAGGFVDELGNPSPTATSWITADANRKLRIGNGRLTFGQTKLEVNTTTADTSIPTWGEFDLSKAYKVSFCVVQVSAASASNFEIYVDNNTTGGNNSIYGAGNASRILQVATHTLVPGTRQEVLVPKAAGDKQIGSATSFFQWRVSSGGFAVIDDVVVEYVGEPHSFTLPACVAENSIAPAPEVAPATPAAPSLIAGDAELVVSWANAGTDATYEVAYGITNDVTAATAFSGNPVTGTIAQLTGLTNGQEYFVWVKAKNVVGSSEYSPSSSATPAAPTGTDASKEWGFNSLAYSSFLTGSTSPLAVTVGATPYDADGLMIFLSNYSANNTSLRYRSDSNVWNFNGNSFRSGDSRVPVVGEAVAELRTYIGVPVVQARAATITFTLKQTGSSQTGKAVIVDQDNKVVSVIDLPYITPVPENPSASNVALPITLAEGHNITELRLFYSREGTSGGGMDLMKLLKSYTDNPLEPSSSSSSAASSSVPASSSSEASSSSSSVAPSSSSDSSSSSSSVDGGASSSDASSSSSSIAALSWTDSTLDLFGSAVATAPVGSSVVQNNGATVVLNATGGTMTQDSAFRVFFTNIPASGQFVFVARLASVTAKSGTSFTAPGNSYGFGVMVIKDKPASVASFANVPAFATLNLFTSSTVPAFSASRAHKMDSTAGNRSRSNVSDMKVGDYLRIEVFRDVNNVYRVRRSFSANGTTYTDANSSAWATGENENWFVGLYAAPGAEELEITFDNISLTPYVAPPPI